MNALEELTEDRIDRDYVERRVENWKARIADLYANVAALLPAGWRASGGLTKSMHEELMQRFGMPPEDLPVLRLEQADGLHGRSEPRGLWIIGNNGRVDLILPDRHFLIIDRSEIFESGNRQSESILDRRRQKPFDRQALCDMLA